MDGPLTRSMLKRIKKTKVQLNRRLDSLTVQEMLAQEELAVAKSKHAAMKVALRAIGNVFRGADYKYGHSLAYGRIYSMVAVARTEERKVQARLTAISKEFAEVRSALAEVVAVAK